MCVLVMWLDDMLLLGLMFCGCMMLEMCIIFWFWLMVSYFLLCIIRLLLDRCCVIVMVIWLLSWLFWLDDLLLVKL